MRFVLMLTVFLLAGCATPRLQEIIPIDLGSRPATNLVRATCGDKKFTTRGVVVCQTDKVGKAIAEVKFPPVEGQFIYSDGLTKITNDFNWAEERVFLWIKRKKVNDTWGPLNLKELSETFGEVPIAGDVAGINTATNRLILFYHLCKPDDCWKLRMRYECAKVNQEVVGLGKCIRMSGTRQKLVVFINAPEYIGEKKNIKLHVVSDRLGIKQSYTIKDKQKTAQITLPVIPSGVSFVGLRLAFTDKHGNKHREDGRVLIVGQDKEWTPIDKPHYQLKDREIKFTRPLLADYFEVNLYDARNRLIKKEHGNGKRLELDYPPEGGLACAFAWSREASDMSWVCVDKKGRVKDVR